MGGNERRLIEDYLPIQAISAEASREKSVRKGHISTLHLWWARRPLVACRAAVYGALVQAARFRPANGPEEKRDSLARANAARFVERLCKYPGDARVIAEAQQHILEAHAERLSAETGQAVTAEDILQGRAPRPKVLDMFAGGGAIPLEALRLGCETYALDLNPVAYIIELCTLVYPQKYGKPDKTAKGSAKDGTWAGLAEEVRYWGQWVLEKVKAEIGDLYPLIPDPKFKGERPDSQLTFWPADRKASAPQGYLIPVAYLWTRTVRCKNPLCGATVPLLRQTWLCKKNGRHVALRVIAPKGDKRVRFEVAEVASERDLGFDPATFSRGGNATCLFCGTVADSDYVKAEGCAGRMGQQMMGVACTRPGLHGKVYLSADDLQDFAPDDEAIRRRIDELCVRTAMTVPNEAIVTDAKNALFCILYGITRWSDLFSARQLLAMLTFASTVHSASREMQSLEYDFDRLRAVCGFLGVLVDEIARFGSTNALWKVDAEAIVHMFGRQTITVSWDFCEGASLGDQGGTWSGRLEYLMAIFREALGPFVEFGFKEGIVLRGPATADIPPGRVNGRSNYRSALL